MLLEEFGERPSHWSVSEVSVCFDDEVDIVEYS